MIGSKVQRMMFRRHRSAGRIQVRASPIPVWWAYMARASADMGEDKSGDIPIPSACSRRPSIDEVHWFSITWTGWCGGPGSRPTLKRLTAHRLVHPDDLLFKLNMVRCSCMMNALFIAINVLMDASAS